MSFHICRLNWKLEPWTPIFINSWIYITWFRIVKFEKPPESSKHDHTKIELFHQTFIKLIESSLLQKNHIPLRLINPSHSDCHCTSTNWKRQEWRARKICWSKNNGTRKEVQIETFERDFNLTPFFLVAFNLSPFNGLEVKHKVGGRVLKENTIFQQGGAR